MCVIICVLKTFGIILLLLMAIIAVFVLISLMIFFILLIIKKIFKKPWCHINTDISASLDGGINYTKNYHSVYGKVVHLKCEITAKAYGFLSGFCKCKIPFVIKILESQDKKVSFCEYDGVCDPELAADQAIINDKDYKFKLWTKGKKTETAIIVLKCDPGLYIQDNSFFVFKLLFEDKFLKQYSRTITLDFK